MAQLQKPSLARTYSLSSLPQSAALHEPGAVRTDRREGHPTSVHTGRRCGSGGLSACSCSPRLRNKDIGSGNGGEECARLLISAFAGAAVRLSVLSQELSRGREVGARCPAIVARGSTDFRVVLGFRIVTRSFGRPGGAPIVEAVWLLADGGLERGERLRAISRSSSMAPKSSRAGAEFPASRCFSVLSSASAARLIAPTHRRLALGIGCQAVATCR